MARRCVPAALICLCVFAAESRAQFTYYPYGIPLPASVPALAVSSGGVAFQFHGRRFDIAGFLGGSPTVYYPVGVNPFVNPLAGPFAPFPTPFPAAIVPNPLGPNPFNPTPFAIAPAIVPFAPGVVNTRINVQFIQPPAIGGPQIFLGGAPAGPDPELAGVDLDVVAARKLNLAAEKDVKKPEVVARLEDKKSRVIMKPDARPDVDKPKAAAQAKKVEAPRPLPPGEENARLVELGLAAMRGRQFGLAALRFRQATEAAPELARPYFLLAQADIAVGSYKDARAAIEAGLRRNVNWPRLPFQPRAELYKGIDLDFNDHLKRLQMVQEKAPNDPTYLFLTAYMLWFDGRRDDAVPLLQRARRGVADAGFIDIFLRAEGVVAAK